MQGLPEVVRIARRNPYLLALNGGSLDHPQVQVVHTDAVVTVAGPRFSVTGKGMTVVVPDKTVTFHNEVDSTFIPEGKGPPPGATVE